MKNLRFFLALTGFTALCGCDKIEPPYGEGVAQPQDTTVTYFRKVLIEDFTGQACGNCPPAAEALEQIHDLYGSAIVSMGVHADFWAEPNPHFPEDYRNSVSTELFQFFGIPGNPNGLVNRKSFDNITVLGFDAWSTSVALCLAEPADAWLTVVPEYNAGTRSLSVEVETRMLDAINEELQLVLYLTEDSIMGPQKYYGSSYPDETVPEYYHRHMLRGSMNGTWGNALSSATTYSTGQEINSSFNFTIPSEWNADHVHIVALLYKTATKEVVQAEEKEIY